MLRPRWTREQYLSYRERRWDDDHWQKEPLEDRQAYWEADDCFGPTEPMSASLRSKRDHALRRVKDANNLCREAALSILGSHDETMIIQALTEPNQPEVFYLEMVLNGLLPPKALETLFLLDRPSAQEAAIATQPLDENLLARIQRATHLTPSVRDRAHHRLTELKKVAATFSPIPQ